MGSSSSKNFSYDEALLKDVNSWVYEVPDSKEHGFSSIYRNPQFPDGFELPRGDDDEPIDNVWQLFENSSRRFKEANCMGFRPYEGGDARGDFVYLNYGSVFDTCESIAAGLSSLGLKYGETVGIYSKNRAEWMQVHLANQRQGYQTVALYDTLGDEAVAYIVQHADLRVVCCERSALKNVISAKTTNENQLDTVIIFDYQDHFGNIGEQIDQDDIDSAKAVGLTLVPLSKLIQDGAAIKNGVPKASVSGKDCCFLMYTSGTTGNPKGVQLSHAGFTTISYSVAHQVEFFETDKHLSFLPLAHIFECLVETVLLNNGASVAYYQGNIRKLTEDWCGVRPTIIIGVPRVFAKVYDRAMAKAAGLNCIKKYFFDSALAASAEASRTGDRVAKWDNKIWSEVAKQVGFDKCRMCLSGAAPLPPYLAEFLRILLIKGKIVQGYGMTESTGGSLVQTLDDLCLGNVGIPLGGVDMRLEDIPDMNYMTSDPNPRGEILLRGTPVMMGYYKNQAATDKTIVNGWLHTGDVGRLNPNGTMSIIDRKKNLFKTSFGEYIAVEKIESAYGKSGSVSQVWVYGNSFKSFIVAVVVPDALWAMSFLQSKGGWPVDDHSVIATPEFCEVFVNACKANSAILREAVLASMRQQEGELKRFERVKDIMLEVRLDNLLQGFNVHNNLLTPSFKLKRPKLLKAYVEPLKELYKRNGEPPKADEHWIK